MRQPVRTVWRVFAQKAPVNAQLIITRRCNLSCGYCFEYDNASAPVPLDTLKQRIDALHRLHVTSLTLLGGEPLMHPQLCDVVRHAARKCITTLITNGFLLTPGIVDDLNEAGLDHMQISVDSLMPTPDMFIQKSLKSLQRRLEMLRDRATFALHVTTVLCPETVDGFDEFVGEIETLGIPVSLGLVHDEDGRVAVQGQPYIDAWRAFHERGGRFASIEREYGSSLLRGEEPEWHCRAGHRYLYVDEYGVLQLCASQTGRIGRNIVDCRPADLRGYGDEKKGCEPGCIIGCAYRASVIDDNPLPLVRDWLRGEMRLRRSARAGLSRAVDARDPART
jgi:MoaA/NifB/PqqE/SkfB family radical SAM enzyme